MDNKIRLGIVGFGNLGSFSLNNVAFFPDMEVKGVFSRRKPSDVNCSSVPVYGIDKIKDFVADIDVMLLCGGSANDLMSQSVEITKYFNTVNTFDTHANIPQHFHEVDKVAKDNNKVAIISVGWDPGLFSINRVLADSIIPNNSIYSFWGKGVSQGHSNAIRNLPEVEDAVQFTIPSEELVNKALSGEKLNISNSAELHSRLCYVVLKSGANEEEVRNKIVTMPNYFADYKTTVNFITKEEFTKNFAGKLPHGGQVIGTGSGTKGEKMTMNFNLTLDSNPSFTSCVVLAYARAAYKMSNLKEYGAKTVLDVPLKYLSARSYDELLSHYI